MPIQIARPVCGWEIPSQPRHVAMARTHACIAILLDALDRFAENTIVLHCKEELSDSTNRKKLAGNVIFLRNDMLSVYRSVDQKCNAWCGL